jgi:putative DNA primase/helicase
MGIFLDLETIKCVRQARRVWHPFDNVHYPFAMVAKVVSDNRAINLHITYLDDEGVRIETKKPKLVMAGKLPPGCAIPLTPVAEHLGIAEGIETALACQILTGVPTWAAVNATVLSQWSPPEGVKKVTVFGDNDMSYTGQAKAYCLANRLVVRDKLSVTVELPEADGADWADIVLAGAR